MNESVCKLCGGTKNAAATHEGDVVVGGYGSAKYDTCSLVWLKAPPRILPIAGLICDSCIDSLTRDGHLEPYFSALDGDVGMHLSKDAYRAIFLMGARNMYEFSAKERGFYPSEAKVVDAAGAESMERFRRQIGPDMSNQYYYTSPNRKGSGLSVERTGAAHALAAILLGYAAGQDPDFTEAAETFAEKAAVGDEFLGSLLDFILENDAQE